MPSSEFVSSLTEHIQAELDRRASLEPSAVAALRKRVAELEGALDDSRAEVQALKLWRSAARNVIQEAGFRLRTAMDDVERGLSGDPLSKPVERKRAQAKAAKSLLSEAK